MSLTGVVAGPPRLPHQILNKGLHERPDEIALMSQTQRWTWRELDLASTNLAHNLLAMGLVSGDRVASLMPNRTQLVVHYLACFKAGLVVVPLNYRYLAGAIDHALEVSEASLLIAHVERVPDIESSEWVPRLPLGVCWFETSSGQYGPVFEHLLQPAGQGGELPTPPTSTPCSIFFTSGSTGSPKGVTHSHGSLGAMLTAVSEMMEIVPADVVLPGSSLSHLGAFMFTFAALASGATAVVARSLSSVDMVPLLRQSHPTVLCMLPAAMLQLLHEQGLQAEDFASLRLCRGGADKVPAELEREFIALTGFPIDEGYGMTEVGLATLNPPSGNIKIGSIGRALPGFELSIRNGDGVELSPGDEGVLWMRSPTVTTGYWNNPMASQALFENGWLNSGDVVTADREGYLWFKGRKKQIIVHDGSNISPQEVEDVLLDHPAVESAGVVGVHDTLHGENVWAFVVRADCKVPTDEHALILYSRGKIGYKAPEHIFFIEEMPLNATGKVDRLTLKRWAEDRHHSD